MSQTIFVTGGAGYIGSHCCKAFSRAGWNVVVYDNLSRGWRDFVKWGDLIEGDLRDLETLNAAIAKSRPDAIAHFGAVAYVGESVTRPEFYYDNNVVGSLNLLQAMLRNSVDKILFSSTCATYGMPQVMPVSEHTAQQPISPYGWSKLFVERMLGDFDRAHGIRSISLRYFNAAGADPDGEIGERHEPEPHLIPLALEAALRGDSELTIFGDDFATPDGTCVRDYIHVADLAEAHVAALRRLLQGARSDVFNLGTETGISVKSVLDAVERVTGLSIRRKVGLRRDGDPAIVVAASAKARAVLGWVPRHSTIDQIVNDAYRWQLCADAFE